MNFDSECLFRTTFYGVVFFEEVSLLLKKPLSDMFPRNKWNVKWRSIIVVNPQVKFICAQQKFF